jgi:Fe-Mn family superoxide dismutase
LEPHIGEQTLVIHHDRHHAKVRQHTFINMLYPNSLSCSSQYVDNTKSMIKGTDLEGSDLVTILRHAHTSGNQGLFNNAAQSYNHAFYWECMKAGGGGQPSGRLAALIDSTFGNYGNFRTEFVNAGLTAFGSGWAWLVYTPEGLKVTKTSNAHCPLTESGHVPLLTMDVWEHAYYLNYQNNRGGYEEAFLDHLVNWEFVERQLPADA